MSAAVTPSLPRANPSSQGVDPRAVGRFLDAIAAHAGLELHSMMLLRHGRVVAEGWWSPYEAGRQHQLFSLSKSFCSTAVGFAVSEGLVKLDERVIDIFPDIAPEGLGPYWDELTVHHLLSMNTGHTIDTTEHMLRHKQDMARAFFDIPLMYRPGTRFLYNTGATYMCSAVVERRSGLPLLDYLTPRLLKPLGISGATWETCPKGIAMGGFGLSVRTEDIAAFGQFFLNRGVWNCKRLLEEGWFDQALYAHSDNSGHAPSPDWTSGYGYQFWKCKPEGIWRGDGAAGQYCVMMPAQDAVLAMTGGLADMGAVLSAAWEHLLPGFSAADKGAEAGTDECPQAGVANCPQAPANQGIPATVEDAALADRLRALSYAPPTGVSAPDAERGLHGKRFAIRDNPAGLRAVTLRFDADGCEVEVEVQDAVHSLRLGRERWVMGTGCAISMNFVTERGEFPVAAAFAWGTDGALTLVMRDVGGPTVLTWRLVFKGERMAMAQCVNVSFGPLEADFEGNAG